MTLQEWNKFITELENKTNRDFNDTIQLRDYLWKAGIPLHRANTIISIINITSWKNVEDVANIIVRLYSVSVKELGIDVFYKFLHKFRDELKGI